MTTKWSNMNRIINEIIIVTPKGLNVKIKIITICQLMESNVKK